MFKNSPQKSSSIMDIAHAYGLGWECSRNRYIAQRNIYGEVNRNKSKNVTTKDIERAFMKGWACGLGCACAEREQTISTINKVNLNKSSGVFLNNENDTIEYSSYFSDALQKIVL